MYKLLIVLAIAISPIFALAKTQPLPLSIEQCTQHSPWGLPVSQQRLTLICRTGYITAHDNTARIPAWTAHRLEPVHVMSCNPRDDAFAADASLPPGQRAELRDYVNSGYDMGHMVPSADQVWSTETEYQSFFLSNMSPQLPGLNRAIWKQLETSVRAWAHQRNHALVIYTGSVYLNSSKRIGTGVVVPDAFWKIVVDTVTGETLAFGFPHSEKLGRDLQPRQTSVAEIEQVSGIRFPLALDKNRVDPMWAVDIAKFNRDKKALCAK